MHFHQHLGARNKAIEAGRKRKGGKRKESSELLSGKHTSNRLVPRRVWDHNFSIQLGVKLGSSSIDFFPGYVAVFLATNSKCRPSTVLDVIAVTHQRELFLD